MPTSTSHSNSNSNSNNNSNPTNSRITSSNASRSASPYGSTALHLDTSMEIHRQVQPLNHRQEPVATNTRSSSRRRPGHDAPQEEYSPSIPNLIYIVTSHFTSQTMSDGTRLSESDVVGFQILAVFGRLEDANSYAEHECEEIDAGVRRRRLRTTHTGAVGGLEGDGIRVDAIVRNDGTVSWSVEGIGQIEVGQWVVQ